MPRIADSTGPSTLGRRLPSLGDGQTLHGQLSARIRRAILGGQLAPGARVPSARALAIELGVARGTVVGVYQRLEGEGYLSTRGAAGSFVSSPLPVAPRAARREPAREPRPDPGAVPSLPLPFRLGVPGVDAFPISVWSRLLARRARAASVRELAHADPLGALALRRAIAAYLAVARGVLARPEQVLITAGFQGALGVLGAAFPRARVWLEEPGYALARDALALSGARIRSIPVDSAGMRFGSAERGATPELIVVTASHQMPLGVPLSLARRLALLAFARRSDAWIVEDDYDGEFHYEGPPLPALASLEAEPPVIYAGTFSKTMFPALRLGYLVLPERVRARVTRCAAALSPAPSPLLQLAVADFLNEGHFARHIKRMRALYADRRAALQSALQRRAGSLLRVEPSAGGLHLLARFAPDSALVDRQVVERAATLGLAPRALSAQFARPSPHANGLLLGFPALPARQADARVARLVQALNLPGRY